MRKIKPVSFHPQVIFDYGLLALLSLALIGHYLKFYSTGFDQSFLVTISFVGTLPVLWSAILSLKEKKVSVDLLASVALLFSLLSGEWISAVFINLMLTSARIFLDYSQSQARRTIAALLKLKPQKAKIKKESQVIEVPLNHLKKGDLVVVELGERVPIDGVVIEGEAMLDQSSLTGESLPVPKQPGDKVLSSTLVESGNLTIKTEKVGEETTLEKIIDLVEKSRGNKAAVNTLAERFASWYILSMFIFAFIVYFFSGNLGLVLAILLVVCADDIAVAVPQAFLTAIIYAARRGVIIKGSSYLEGLDQVRTIVADKTGTLTRGRLKIEKIVALNGYSETEVLTLMGGISFLSDHPISKAIKRLLKEKEIKITQAPVKVTEFSGKGITGNFQTRALALGRPEFLESQGVKFGRDEGVWKEPEKDGFSVTLLAAQGKLAGFAVLADELRPNIKNSIELLKKEGIERVVMLTGDNETIASRVAGEVGITLYHSSLLPEDKINYLTQYLNPQTKVMMIGDGINDAAALSRADIGVAMGGIGMDVAIESADIVLVKDDFARIPEIIQLSRYVMKIVREDFWIWGIVNAVGLWLVLARVLSPTGAAAYNFLTDFIPLFNSSRILSLYLKKQNKK